jgi:N6-L-threonylcarbamoyladenine synthase/protein kinase Bud32
MRVLGIEGTAWAASAALYDVETGAVTIETEAYRPASGGLHPREAAEHMREHVPSVVERVLEAGSATDDRGGDSIDAVAFSRGPGLGPCLRIAGTAARALAGSLDVPLLGVNHMLAHLEIGRHRSGFAAPLCLNASGANAHVLGYRGGRYRVLGETMDTGVGNALDKFARHLGWPHPGGPRIEARAEGGEYVDLPYVVKGMDFSFSGLLSAAKAAVDDGTPVEDVCFSLQETVFGMLAEVSERALSLTDSGELVLGGGVGQNRRLQAMLAEMCAERGAGFFAPEDRFLRDNAGMIAVLGAKMAAAGDTVAIADSRVRPDFRPDEVAVTWREGAGRSHADATEKREGAVDEYGRGDATEIRGAEAVVELGPERVVKRRLPKPYRHSDLDARLRRERIVAEARLTSEARRVGVPTPVVHDVDAREATLTTERVGRADLREALTEERVRTVAGHLATLHGTGFVHGDPTTRNVRVGRSSPPGTETGGGRTVAEDDEAPGERVFLIDFGLGYYTDAIEDYAMDLHVFEGSVLGTADDPELVCEAFEAAYTAAGDPAVVEQLREIEGRGRYR